MLNFGSYSHRSRMLAALLCLALALLSFACHKKPQTAAGNLKPKTGAGESQQQVIPKPPVEDIQDRTNPMPTGPTWVHSDKVQYRIGETMQIKYKLKRGASGKPWIGLIPIQIEAQDEGTNDANDIEYVYIDESQAESGKTELPASKNGDYYIRLFGSDADTTGLLQGQTKIIAIRDWPQGNLVGPVKPYVMLEGEKPVAPDEVEPPLTVKSGGVLKGTYELAEAYPKDAWIGLIPWSVFNRGGEKNDAADVAYTYLDPGVLSGSFEFPLDKITPGEYVIRLFPCGEGDPNATFQSVKIIVQ